MNEAEIRKDKKCHDFVCSAGKHKFCISFFDCHHTLDIIRRNVCALAESEEKKKYLWRLNAIMLNKSEEKILSENLKNYFCSERDFLDLIARYGNFSKQFLKKIFKV